jgi:hypothetical protein
LGKRSSSANHEDAVSLILKMSTVPASIRGRFAGHLESLLFVKDVSQYSGEPLTEEDARQALLHLHRAAQAVRSATDEEGWLPLVVPNE